MGLFSLFRSKDPAKVARELVEAATRLEVDPEAVHWCRRLGVETHRYIAERNALQVGMTQGGVALSLRTNRSPNVHKLYQALEEQLKDYFSRMPNVHPEQGLAFYRCITSRYIVRDPVEMAGIFHYYLLNPGAWEDREPESTPSQDLPEGFQSFVHVQMREPLQRSLDRANELAM